MKGVKSRKGQRHMLVLIQKAAQFSPSSVRMIQSETFSLGQVVMMPSRWAVWACLLWDHCLRITSARTATLFSKSQPRLFGCSLNPKLCHLGLLEWGTKSSFSVQTQNLSVLRASNGMSAVTMSSTGRACIECARHALLWLTHVWMQIQTPTQHLQNPKYMPIA